MARIRQAASRAVRNSGAPLTTSWQLERYLRGGDPTAAGVTVTADTAVEVSTVFACIRNIAEDLGKLPYPVYRELPDGGKEQARTSPFWSLTHDRWFGGPNTFSLTSQQSREMMTAWAILHGNSYAFKNPPGVGQTRELIPIHPRKVTPEQLDDFEVVYHVRMPDGTQKTHTRRDIAHLAGFGMDGIGGANLAVLAKQSIGLAKAQEEYEARLYGNAATPRGVLKKSNGVLSEDAWKRLNEEWTSEYGGLANQHKIALLEDGLEFQALGMNAEDLQQIAGRTYTVGDLARWMRMPLHKVNEMSHSTFTNIEHQSIEYVVDTLLPWGVRWDNFWNLQIIGTNSVYAQINFEGLLRGDTASRYEAYQKATGGPWMAGNEARRLENLDPLPGLDEVLVPLNMGARSQLGQTAESVMASNLANALIRLMHEDGSHSNGVAKEVIYAG